MPGRLRSLFQFPTRHPGWAVLAVLVLVLAGAAGWQGSRILRFNQARADAETALAQYDFAEARRRLDECLRLRPRDPAVRLLAAQAARRDGDLDAADEHLRRHRDLVGDWTDEARMEWTLLKAQRGQVEEVVDYLISCLEVHHPKSEQILEALAMGCVHVYHLKRASFWVSELLKRHPKNPIGRLLRAQTAETLRDHDKALRELRRLVEEYPRFAEARQALAELLYGEQQYDEAVGHYEELHRRDPDGYWPLLGLARCRNRLGQTEEARPLVRELEDRYPDDSEALLECGRFALRERRPADAERLLRRAVELAPNDHEVHRALGTCLHHLGRGDESRRHFDRSERIEEDLRRLEKVLVEIVQAPSDPGPRLEAGRICLRNGQTAEGLRWLTGALDIAPDHKETHAALAAYFTSQGDSARAEYHRRRSR